MSRTARSLFIFSFYVMASGLALLIFPAVFLRLAGLPESAVMVARILGMVVLFVGLYYFRAGRCCEDMTDFYRFTIFVRSLSLVGCGLFVLIGKVSPLILIFGGLDFAGAMWTLGAYNKEN